MHQSAICVNFAEIIDPTASSAKSAYFESVRADFAVHPAEIPHKNESVAGGEVEVPIEHLLGLSDEQFELLPTLAKDACRANPAFKVRDFLNYVAKATPDKTDPTLIKTEAEALLKAATPAERQTLLRTPGQFTDYSGRTFNCTAFEYAYWAKDWHMCQMLQSHMDEMVKAEMLKRAEAIDRNGLNYSQRGELKNSKHFSFQELKDAYKHYLEIYKLWRKHTAADTELDVAWFAIGRAQRDVPAYVAQEYCRTDRSFLPQPTFGEETFPRTLMFCNSRTGREEFWFSFATSDTSGLGKEYTAFRGSCEIVMGSISRPHGRSTFPPTGMGRWHYAEVDFHAINALDTMSMYLIDSLRKKLKPSAVRFALA
jgi:hypothetical protein